MHCAEAGNDKLGSVGGDGKVEEINPNNAGATE